MVHLRGYLIRDVCPESFLCCYHTSPFPASSRARTRLLILHSLKKLTMTDDFENTPFLTDNEHDDDIGTQNEHLHDTPNKIPANGHFKRAIKALTIVLVVFSALTFMSAIASFVMILVGSFTGYIYGTREVLKDLGICVSSISSKAQPNHISHAISLNLSRGTRLVPLPERPNILQTFVALILSIVMIFIQIPIFLSLVIDIVFPILILVYSGNIFGNGWPDANWCYNYYPEPRIPDAKCLHKRDLVRIVMGVTGGLGFVTGYGHPIFSLPTYLRFDGS